jgi:hypothetical protein
MKQRNDLSLSWSKAMSHIAVVQIEVRDLEAINAACRRLDLKQPVHGRAKIFNTPVEGVIVELGHNWLYPIVCNLDTGELHYDNFDGKWGDKKYLDQFVQAYSIEKATIEARRKGYSVVERSLKDGSIQLTVNVGGAA